MQKFKMATKNGEKKKFLDDSVNNLGVKNFTEIALSHTVSKINEFLHFMQKFKMATRKWWENHQTSLGLPKE